MPVQASRPSKTTAAGVALLFGYFTIFCSLLLFSAAGWRTIQARIHSGWPEIMARVEQCRVEVDHPFASDGGGTIYSLSCKLNYRFADSTRHAVVRTTSTRDIGTRDEIEAWVTLHRPESPLVVRVNPRAPEEALIVEELPVHQRPTAADGLSTAIPFLLVGVLLCLAGFRLRRRDGS